MSAPNVSAIYRSPGRLVANPSSLASAYPHGGTELGIARDMAFKPGLRNRKLVTESFKGVVEVLYVGHEAIMAGVMRTWDNAMMAILFPGTQTSSKGDVGLLMNVQSTRAGKKMSTQGVTLFFSPMAVDLHKCILIYNAVPIVDEAFEMQVSLSEELGIPFVFQAIPDAQGRTYAVDLRANLTL